jgi:prepilin-type N-terminal cleavage/methylation domain-containing protein
MYMTGMSIKDTNKKAKGFSLVELLIAISLIAILSGVLLSVINPMGIQKKARDSQRVSDLAKVKVALENYFADNRRYPIWNDFYPLTNLAPVLVTGYINKLPTDPKPLLQGPCVPGGVAWRNYGYKSIDGKKYLLVANMETASAGSTACPAGVDAAWCNCTFTGGTGYYTTAD